ncbi:MAG: efflux RND transporter periplasmic adaptor subunit [Planctomycetota bacterium]|nr:efflux RND transporter periplasmic adaptor subunit [Planctomycetota bacterium]
MNELIRAVMDKIISFNITKRKVIIAVVILIVLIWLSCSGKSSQTTGTEQATPVVVATAEEKTVPIELTSFGTVEAYSSIAIKTQVTGILNAVHFTEGQDVNEGDLLLSIDPRPSQADLKVSQANLAKDEVQLKNAEKEVARQKELLAKGFAAQGDYDTSVTVAETFRAAVGADKAAVENAMLQLEYCSIRSPVTGRIGSLLVNRGNLVKLNDISVATIKQIVPVYVSFSVPQQYLPDIQKYMSAGKLDVTVKQQKAQGLLSFVDNTVDTTTGTIRLRATFTNETKSLWPGQYVEVTVILTNEPNAIIVPSAAVQISQTGQFVYVLKPDQTVELRPVTVKRTINNHTVLEGVKAGESVVTDGQLRLVPGAKVVIKNGNQK